MRKVPLVFPISNIEICFIIIHINRINQLGFKVFELNEIKIKYTIKGWRERGERHVTIRSSRSRSSWHTGGSGKTNAGT